MNPHWVTKLGEVAQFVRGLTYKPTDVLQEMDAGAIPCLRTKNIQQFLEDDDLIFIPDRLVKAERRVAEGDILVSSANSWNLVGKCCWVPNLGYEATFGGFTSLLRADRQRIEPRYLYHWFSWDKTQTVVRSFGQQTTNISNLNQNRCLELSVPVPPLDEQRRIAAILDKADALRQKRKRAIALLDSLTQSIFLEMFGNPVANDRHLPSTTLGLLGVAMKYGPRFYNEAYSNNGTRIVRITDLSATGALDFDAMPKLLLSEIELAEHRSQPGELLFARTGATVGKIAIISDDDPICVPGAYFIRLRFPDIVHPLFAAVQMRSKTIQTIVAAKSGQSAQQNFSGPGLRELPFLVPPMSEQAEFARRMSLIATQRDRMQAVLRTCEVLFASLQHRAFHGQL